MSRIDAKPSKIKVMKRYPPTTIELPSIYWDED
jgi:hypothetical protein